VFLGLALLFLLSGFSALIYQVVWLRSLSLIFGVTVYAASAVLTSFMGGLALGSWIGGRAADRLRHPLAAFGLVEIAIGALALAVPLLLNFTQALYGAVHAQMPDAPALLTATRVVGSGLVLLLPTTLMGASLPLVSRFVSLHGGTVAARIGLLYAVNTLGGILGVVLSGFVLVGAWGTLATSQLAAAINVAVGFAALLLGRAVSPSESPAHGRVPEAAPPLTPGQRRVLLVFALAGFAGLALEVVWFRILVLFIPATTYAFTTMLAVVLLGIALGSGVLAGRLRRVMDPARTLARVQAVTGVLVLLSMAALVVTYRLGWRTSGMVQACVVAMLPATILMGATFPLGLRIWLGDAAGGIASRVGVLYATNVCGAVAGALAGGFVLLPLLGSESSLVLLSVVYGASGVLLVTGSGMRATLRFSAATGALLLGAWLSLPDLHAAVVGRRHGQGERVLFREEGVQTTAAVHFQPSGRRVLYLDGLHQANDSREMVRVHAEIGHLAMLLHPRPDRTLVIGLGGGVTAGAVAVHQTEADVVELARSVVSAARLFAVANGNVLQRPNVRLRVEDGRNYLTLTRQRYDVVTADIIQPVHAGAGNLYSREYFQLARGVLNEGGLMLQWIGDRDEEHYKLIMRTFLDVFPEATLWSGGTLMVGAIAPLRISRDAVERQLADAGLRLALARVALDSYDALLARYTAGPDEMRSFVGNGPLLTDDRPLLEYHRSIVSSGRVADTSGLRGSVLRHVERPSN
jgi:spermidine synthase